MKLLITGSNGQLGRDCTRLLEQNHAVMAADVDELDITRLELLREVFRTFSPDMVLNCAAYTRVDACERHEEDAFRVNALGPENLARCAAENNAWLLHVSTDYVFDGRRTPPAAYAESDPPGPVSAYGRTKLAGEQRVRQTGCRFMIVRTAWLYGIHGPNFLKTMLGLALADPDRTIRVVNDQYGNPTWSRSLAVQIEQLAARPQNGIYHASSQGMATWYELASRFLTAMKVPHRIAPCTTEQYPTPAKRPANSMLENRALKHRGMHVMRGWEMDLNVFVERHRLQLLEEMERTS